MSSAGDTTATGSQDERSTDAIEGPLARVSAGPALMASSVTLSPPGRSPSVTRSFPDEMHPPTRADDARKPIGRLARDVPYGPPCA